MCKWFSLTKRSTFQTFSIQLNLTNFDLTVYPRDIHHSNARSGITFVFKLQKLGKLIFYPIIVQIYILCKTKNSFLRRKCKNIFVILQKLSTL